MRKNSTHFYPYRPAALIEVSGDDAFSFLQGQFTNELRQPTGSVTYGLWLNQKGKTLADSHVLRQGENSFLLLSSASPAAVIQQRLEQYIIADDVVLRNATDEVRGLAIWGEQSGDVLKGLLGRTIPPRGQFLNKDAGWIFQGARSSGENYEMIGSESALSEWRQRLLASGCIEADANEVEAARIMAGIPNIPQDIGPTDLPNEAGLEATAISFTKGCYLGQEVMARLKNLGQVRRQLRRVRGVGAPPAIGAALFQAGKKMGEIRSAAPMGDEFIAWAMLTRMGLDENLGFDFEASNEAGRKASLWTS